MSIVSGSSPKLYISNGSETHSIKFVSYSLGQENTFSSYSNSKLTTTPNRAMTSYVDGENPVSFELETYFHFYDNAGLVSSAEKLLWESITATTSQEFLSNCVYDFSSSSSNKLGELTIWLELQDGVVWQLSNMVVETASIDLDINKVSSIKWKLSGLTIDINATAPTTYDDRYSDNYYRNKVSTVVLSQLGYDFNLPIISGNISIVNTVGYVQRRKLGLYSTPQEHYVTDRLVTGNITTYNRVGASTSGDLYNNIKTISDQNIGYNLTININGCSVSDYVGFTFNNAIITMPKHDFSGKPLTMEFSFIARETLLGDNDELVIEYVEYVLPEVLTAEINDN